MKIIKNIKKLFKGKEFKKGREDIGDPSQNLYVIHLGNGEVVLSPGAIKLLIDTGVDITTGINLYK